MCGCTDIDIDAFGFINPSLANCIFPTFDADLFLVVWEDWLQDAVGHHEVDGAQVPAQLVGLDRQPLGRGGGRGGRGRRGGAARVEQFVYQGLEKTENMFNI